MSRFLWSAALALLRGASLVAAPNSEADLSSLGAQLVTAVKEGDVARTSALLESWKATGKPWPIGPDAQPLLFFAIEGREKTHPAVIDLLLARGAKVDARGPHGMTALHWAAAHGYTERTAQVLKHHPQLEATDDRGRTALLVAHADAKPSRGTRQLPRHGQGWNERSSLRRAERRESFGFDLAGLD